jgi:hypothetical protein
MDSDDVVILPNGEEEKRGATVINMVAYRQRKIEEEFWNDPCFAELWKESEKK